jgi:hypothetical protein
MKYPRGAAGTDLFLFIVFIIILGVVWAMTGGPERSVSRSGPFLSSPFEEGSLFTIPSVDIPGASTGGTSDGGVFGLAPTEEKSPYAEYVSLSISNARNDDASREYVTIKTSNNLSGTLTISDWRLESSVSKNSVTLGGAVQTPYYGQINTPSPVALSANTTVYVVSGRSPVGVSFRVNSCSGYFEQYQDFEPRLTLSCPFTSGELQRARQKYSGYSPSPACTSYVASMRQCEIASAIQIPSNVEAECQNIILNDFSYNGCASSHQGDGDFYKNEWRLFLNRGTTLWASSKERIRLLDESGRVIDVVSY